MNHVIAGKIVAFRQRSRARRFFIVPAMQALPVLHNPAAFLAKLHAGSAVDGIVNTFVAGDEAPKHPGIGCVYNSANLKPCDISLPERYLFPIKRTVAILFSYGWNIR